MSPDPTPGAGNMPPAEPSPKRPATWRALYLPKAAVMAVAGAAVAAAFMGTRPDTPAADDSGSAPTVRQAVVQAPPPVVTAPPLNTTPSLARSTPHDTTARTPANAMGGPAACDRCGVVESVQAAAPGHSFEMRIRMDDGSLRTLEQRGALAAGTRVVVEGGSLRLMPG